MKRFFLALAVLLIAANAQASIITYDSTATIARPWLIRTFNILYDDYNGEINSDNIVQGGITSLDIATPANPLVRDAENIGEYVYTGLLAPTATGLASTTTAGTAYVQNDGDATLHRVVKAAEAYTYTASKDTYVSMQYTGKYDRNPQANGAAQPATPSNSIMLFKAVTDGSDVTTVTDLRQTSPPGLRIYEDLKHGLVISRDASDVDAITIGRGEIEFGADNGKVRRNTSSTSVDFATSAAIGGLDAGSMVANTHYYLHAVADPDNSTGFKGIASLSSSDPAVVTTTARLVGWCFATATTTISPDAVGAYRGRSGDAPNVYASRQDGLTLAVGAKTAVSLHTAQYVASGIRPIKIDYMIIGDSAGATDLYGEVSKDGAQVDGTFISQSLDNLSQGHSCISNSVILKDVAGEIHTFDLTATNLSAGTSYDVKAWSLIIQEL